MSSNTSSSSKPTLVLLHGCFTNPTAFDRLAPLLEKAGFPTTRATYPSSNAENPLEASVQRDIEYVRNFLLPLVEKEHRNIILVAHSFGGVTGGGAAVGLSKTDRKAQNLEGGIVGLIYISGNIVREGQTLVESAGGEFPPWFAKDQPREGLAIIDPLFETLAHDCDKSLEPEVKAAAVPQGYRCLETPSTAPAWAEKGYTGRLAYVRTAEDRLNPAFAQDLWIESTGVKWDVVNMNTSHAPYLSRPEELTEHISAFAAKFEVV